MQQEVTGMRRRRPLGITIIAILLFISAVIEIIGGVSSVIGSTPTGTISDVLLGWFPLVLGVIELVLAWGLWTIKPWAYWGTLVVEILIILNSLFWLPWPPTNPFSTCCYKWRDYFHHHCDLPAGRSQCP